MRVAAVYQTLECTKGRLALFFSSPHAAQGVDFEVISGGGLGSKQAVAVAVAVATSLYI